MNLLACTLFASFFRHPLLINVFLFDLINPLGLPLDINFKRYLDILSDLTTKRIRNVYSIKIIGQTLLSLSQRYLVKITKSTLYPIAKLFDFAAKSIDFFFVRRMFSTIKLSYDTSNSNNFSIRNCEETFW